MHDATKARRSDRCVSVEAEGGILRLTLDNPPANVLSLALLKRLEENSTLPKPGEM